MSDGSKIWIGHNNNTHGPYEERVVREWIAEGRLPKEALAWRVGMKDWISVYLMPFPKLPSWSTDAADEVVRQSRSSPNSTSENSDRREPIGAALGEIESKNDALLSVPLRSRGRQNGAQVDDGAYREHSIEKKEKYFKRMGGKIILGILLFIVTWGVGMILVKKDESPSPMDSKNMDIDTIRANLDQDDIKDCNVMTELGLNIMKLRLAGVSMNQVMDKIDSSSVGDMVNDDKEHVDASNKTKRRTSELVTRVYEVVLVGSVDQKAEAASGFLKSIYPDCARAAAEANLMEREVAISTGETGEIIGETSSRGVQPIEIQVQTKSRNVGTTYRGNVAVGPGLEMSWDEIVIVGKVDQVMIKDIIVNRGNCTVPERESLLPTTLAFGERLDIRIFGCNVIEVTVDTGQNSWTGNFR